MGFGFSRDEREVLVASEPGEFVAAVWNAGWELRTDRRARFLPMSTASRIDAREIDPTVGMLQRVVDAAGLPPARLR